MTTLTQAHREWSTRADDERYSSLKDLDHAARLKHVNSRSGMLPTYQMRVEAAPDDNILLGNGVNSRITSAAFEQLCQRANSPAGYLSSLPATLAAQCLNDGLARAPEGQQSACLFDSDPSTLALRAITSEKYGRIWNHEITARLVKLEATTSFQPAPAAFDGSRGLYMGERDMFAFLVDNDRCIFETDKNGGLSRGFFVWNSETGHRSFGVKTFLYEYVCGNHRVWGASNVKEVRIRHIGDAKGRAFDDDGIIADLREYAEGGAADDERRIKACREYRLGTDRETVLDTLLGLRQPVLTQRLLNKSYDLALEREDWYGEPNTVWAMSGALTEVARDMANADMRVAIETAGSKILDLVAA